MHIELGGFRRVTHEGIRVATGDTTRLNAALQVGVLSETMIVTADTMRLRGASSSLGQVVDNGKITGLPLNGRSFVSLAGLAPGVALPPGSSLPRINGGRPRTNEYLFDGISVLQPEPGQVAFFPNVDAIQEFKIESNSPPAEFGRFNGGVVNLTTKSGSNTLRGTLFEFFRHEALNARNFFASANPVKPLFRRNQFGGVAGGPVRRDATFFFLDYQGQRQTIGRTVISTVPTVLQRQGVFTESIGGRVPAIYDPATTTPAGGGVTRTPFAGGVIPSERIDPVARTLLEQYPLPITPGTANNYRRTANESVDQDQFSLRIDQRVTNRGRLFGRLTRFREAFIPVTPLPGGSGVTSGTLGPQDTTAWAFASSYQHAFSDSLLNELRIGDTRRTVGRAAVRLQTSASDALGLPGIPSSAEFPDTLPTFLIGGYQQLGSPPNTATDFGTSVTQIADTITWAKGRHTLRAGADLRWERLNVVQPPSPTGSFTFSNLFTDLPGTANTGTPFASFLLGQVQLFSIDLQQDEIRNRAWFAEAFVQDDWRLSDRLVVNGGLRYTLNFPSVEQTNQAAVFNLATEQLEFLGRDGQPRAARQLHKLNFGPRLGIVGRMTDRTVARVAYGLVWIEMAGITTPFTTPVFPFLQTVSQRTLDNITPALTLAAGPSVAPIPLTPDAGIGQGVFSVDRDLGSGYVQQWNASLERELTSNIAVEVAYVGSKITRVGPSRREPQSVDSRAARAGPVAAAARAQSLLRRHPAVLVARRSDDPRGPAAQTVSAVHDREPVSQQRRNDDLPGPLREARTPSVTRALVPRQLYAIEADGRRVVGIRCVDSHRAGGQLPGRRQLQSPSRARLLDRGHSARVRGLRRVGRAVRNGTAPSRRRADGRTGQRLDADRRAHAAVGHADRDRADDQQQRLRRVRHPAPQPDWRSGAAVRRAVRQPMVQHQRVRRRAAVRDRHELAQPASRPGLPKPRPRGHPACAPAAPHRRGVARGSLQRDQHPALWRAERYRRFRRVRHDHHRRRPDESSSWP